MFKNYLRIAWRNILRNKVSSFINIAGLTVGISCILLIVLYIQDELSYDKFFKDADRIYQVNVEANFGGNEFLGGTTPPPAGAALMNSFPEIETYTRVFYPGDEVVRYANTSTQSFFTETAVLGVDSNFLQVLNYKMLEGNPATALLPTNSIVITKTVARKYFGNASAVGKTLLFGDDRQPFVVSGVIEKIPSQSSLQFDMLRPIASYPAVKQFNWSWVWLQVSTFVKLRSTAANDQIAIQKLEAKFPAMVKQQAADAFRRIGQPLDEFEKKGGKYKLHLQPLTSVHLHSADVGTRYSTLSDIKYIYIFSIVAAFIMILACVNFMNLSTAQSAKRAKEVGIRKVLGSYRKDLVKQFLAEAMLFSCIAAILAFILTFSVIESFNYLAQKELSLISITSQNIWMYLVVLVVIIGLLAGSYPAFYLTSFKAINVLKGNLFKLSGGNRSIRNGLVVFQFTISTALIICTLVVFEQLKFTRNKDLGLEKENVILIANSKRLQNSEEAFRQEIVSLPEIASASIATSVPTKYLFEDGYVPVPANNEQLVTDISLPSFIVDENFVPTLQLQITKGRNFSKEFTDSASVIVNESCVKQVGWKDPIGQYLEYPGNGDQRFKVIGVVKDFNFQSLRNAISPFAIFHTSSKTYDWGNHYIVAKTKAGNVNNAIEKLKGKWKTFTSDTPFDYSFLDEEFASLYQADKRMSVVFNLFTVIAIFVACLGLFGLAAYTAERRTKEIGIRKVLGASVQSVVSLLSKDFVRLVLIASVIAFPLAWWYMNKWLEGFAYRINISWWIFLIAAGIALIIAVLTVSFQAIKAALANPVKSLRAE